VRSSAQYSLLIKILLKLVMRQKLNVEQQKILMLVVFRYFYAYHFQKEYSATNILIKALNLLSESTKKSMQNEFMLFLRVINKLGKTNFIEFLCSNSKWVTSLVEEIDQTEIMGYPA